MRKIIKTESRHGPLSRTQLVLLASSVLLVAVASSVLAQEQSESDYLAALDAIKDIDVTPLGYVFVGLLGILALFVQRPYRALPIILVCFYMTVGQVLLVGPFHFTLLRIVIMAAWLRLVMKREIVPIGFNAIDKAFVIWAFTNSIIYSFFLFEGEIEAFVNRSGFLYDAFGLYFYFRIIIQDFDDVERLLKVISVAIVPLTLIMIVENLTGRNIFSIFGGVPELSWVREGKVRAGGPFRGAMVAGTFGATLLPLLVSLWWQKGGRIFAVIGIAAATIITLISRSGGPYTAYGFGVVTLVFWKFQHRIKSVLWIILLVAVFLQLFMATPIWYLQLRFSEIVGGGGWHRAYLIDMAIAHFDEWWLFGTRYTIHWMPYGLLTNPGHTDITNQYLSEGIKGGILTMFLFIRLITRCFRGLLKVFREFMATEEQPFEKAIMLWTFGASLVVHTVTFTSLTYFDQMIVFWYMLLAIVSWASNLSYESEEEDESRDVVNP